MFKKLLTFVFIFCLGFSILLLPLSAEAVEFKRITIPSGNYYMVVLGQLDRGTRIEYEIHVISGSNVDVFFVDQNGYEDMNDLFSAYSMWCPSENVRDAEDGGRTPYDAYWRFVVNPTTLTKTVVDVYVDSTLSSSSIGIICESCLSEAFCSISVFAVFGSISLFRISKRK